MKCFVTTLLFFAFFHLSSFLHAQDFVYTPKNPAFGGNFLNYQWLLSSANAQNTFEENQSDRFNRDPFEDFEQSLSRQILSQLSRELVNSQFGEGGLEEGTFVLGDFQIDIVNGVGGVNITILNISSGDQTNIVVPYF